jgi:hypothetical protein
LADPWTSQIALVVFVALALLIAALVLVTLVVHRDWG